MKDLIQEFFWRGLLQEYSTGLQDTIQQDHITLYVGFDPTANSLHIGSLLPIIMLLHFQKSGHHPIIIIGGATARIGDPSDKLIKRQLLNIDLLRYNIECITQQLTQLVNRELDSNIPLLNNYDWIQGVSFLEFSRDIGQYIKINDMLSKESIKKRLNFYHDKQGGLSFNEFTYQLLQAYDFFYLYQKKSCLLQIGGSDQWGNITTGIDFIRKKLGIKVHGLTFPLITKSDGTKFGKSKIKDNIWLDSKLTSPYKFFQFWINTSDEDATRFIKMYTFLSKKIIDQLIIDHHKQKHKRILQNRLAIELTQWVHGHQACQTAKNASELLFQHNTNIFTKEQNFNHTSFLSLIDSLPSSQISIKKLKKGISIIDILVETSGLLDSKGEAKRALKEKSILINRKTVDENFIINTKDILEDNYILLQRGKKKYFILKVLKS